MRSHCFEACHTQGNALERSTLHSNVQKLVGCSKRKRGKRDNKGTKTRQTGAEHAPLKRSKTGRLLQAKARLAQQQRNENENGAQGKAEQRSAGAAPVPRCAETGVHKQNRKRTKEAAGKHSRKGKRTPGGPPRMTHPPSTKAINAVILWAFISLRSESSGKGRLERKENNVIF